MAKKKNSQTTQLKDLPSVEDPEDESDSLDVISNILDIKTQDPNEYKKFKYVLYATALFILLSLPFMDRLFELAIPIANSWLFLVSIKALIFFVLFYVLFYSFDD